jgi:hypothetical protein
VIITAEHIQANVKYLGQTTFSKEILKDSLELAQKRIEASKQYMQDHERTDRGWNNEHIARIGTLAEMIAIKYLTDNKIPHHNFAATTEGINTNPDIIVGEHNYDVKGIDVVIKEFRVNFNAHWRKEKRVTDYWFIKITGTAHADHYLCNKNFITQWQINDKSYSKFYFLPESDIISAQLPIVSIPQLAMPFE